MGNYENGSLLPGPQSLNDLNALIVNHNPFFVDTFIYQIRDIAVVW